MPGVRQGSEFILLHVNIYLVLLTSSSDVIILCPLYVLRLLSC